MTNAREIAAVPNNLFTQVALKAIQKWKAKTDPALAPECTKDLTVIFHFTMK